jgi:hypothetical protein
MIVRRTQLWQYEAYQYFREEAMLGLTIALASAVGFQLLMWKRGTHLVRAAVAARRASRHLP